MRAPTRSYAVHKGETTAFVYQRLRSGRELVLIVDETCPPGTVGIVVTEDRKVASPQVHGVDFVALDEFTFRFLRAAGKAAAIAGAMK